MAKKQGRLEKIMRLAKKLVKKGWVKGNFEEEVDGKPCYCADGALGLAEARVDENVDNYDGTGATPSTHDFFRQAGMSPAARKNFCGSVFNWNDHPKRTQAQVVAAFDRAIVKAAAKGL